MSDSYRRANHPVIELVQQLIVYDVSLRQLEVSDLNSQNTIQSMVNRIPSRRREGSKYSAIGSRIDLATFIEELVDGLCSDYIELVLSSSSRTLKEDTVSY